MFFVMVNTEVLWSWLRRPAFLLAGIDRSIAVVDVVHSMNRYFPTGCSLGQRQLIVGMHYYSCISL